MERLRAPSLLVAVGYEVVAVFSVHLRTIQLAVRALDQKLLVGAYGLFVQDRPAEADRDSDFRISFQLDGNPEIRITISLGGTILDKEAACAHEQLLIKSADRELYRSKMYGKDRYHLVPYQNE